MSEQDPSLLRLSIPLTELTETTEQQIKVSLPVIGGGPSRELHGVTMGRFSVGDMLGVLTDQRTPIGPGSYHLMTWSGDSLKDNEGTDVLVGPGFRLGRNNTSTSELMLPYDSCNGPDDSSISCGYVKAFEKEILQDMHSGRAGFKTFRRSSSDSTSSDAENVTITFSPVAVWTSTPVDPSDMSRGVRRSRRLVFSAALGQTDDGIALSYQSVQDAVSTTLRSSLAGLVVIALCSVVFILLVTAWICLSITVPLTQLCELVVKINNLETTVDFPDIVGGSIEVDRVRSTFEKLYKVVRVGNMAFFLGELEKAYTILHDALSLFAMLKNKKAIGVASNNLGVLMLTMFRAMKKTNCPTMGGFSQRKVIKKANQYFEDAISLGEAALKTINDEEGFSVNYLIFMQQLSNRYFNRGVFLLTSRHDHADPAEAERRGVMDLMTSRDMDREVVDNGDQEGFKGDKDVYFELLMTRIKGLLLLMKTGVEDPWGIEDLFDEARKELVSALQTPNHPLFVDLDPAGQMQRLDCVLIDYHMLMARNNDPGSERDRHIRKGAEIGIRMMVEDDYVLGEASILALRALVEYTNLPVESTNNDNNNNGKNIANTNDPYGGMDPSDVRSTLFQYRQKVAEFLSMSYTTKSLLDREAFNASNIGDFNLEVF